MADKDQELRLGFGLGLGLNLSLGLGLNLTPPTPPFPDVHSRSPWNHHLASSELKTMTSIDVNQSPATGSHRDQSEEEAGTSSPNSTVSSASAKRDLSDEEDGDGSRKKLRLSKEQSLILEESFKEHSTLNPKQKVTLAKQLNLRPRQVEVWFQNRRARTKLKQTEVECELLKRCCDNLREENRRIQKEVQELRALKLSPQLYMHMTPPTTLTMCPSCERLSSNPSASAVSATSAQRHPAAAAAAAAVAPWAPIPMRATSFIGAQRS